MLGRRVAFAALVALVAVRLILDGLGLGAWAIFQEIRKG